MSRKRSIFIVEDEAVISLTIEQALTNLGYTVAGMAPSGEECLSVVGTVNPDLVLMDIRLRGKMDGIETAEAIRKKFGFPVVFLTAYSNRDMLQRAKTTEPFGYLVKPFNERDLYSAIEIGIHRAEVYKRLSSSERKFREIADSIDEIVTEIDGSGKFRYLNTYGATILGIGNADISNYSFFDFIEHKKDREHLKAKLSMSLLSLPEEPAKEIPLQSSNRRILFFREGLKPVIEDERVTGLRGILVNITHTKYKQTLQQAVSDLSDLLRDDTITYDGFVFYIIKLIKTLTGASSVYFNKFEQETNSVFTYERTSSRAITHKDERVLTNWIIQNRQPLFLRQENIKTFLSSNNIPPKEIQAKSWLGFPIRIGESIFGVLGIQSFESGNFFSDEDFDIFKDCAHEISYVFQSISFKLKARQELAQSESNKKAIIHAIPDSLLIVSNEGMVLDGYLKGNFTGLQNDRTIQGKKFTKLFDKENHRRLQSEFRKFLRQTTQPVDLAISDHISGKWFELRFVHIDAQNKLILVRDVTAGKKQEAELRKFFNLIEQSEEIIIVTDKNGLIEYVNPKFSEVTGFEFSEAIGKKPAIMGSGKHTKKFFRNFWKMILDGNSFNGELINRKRNGEIFIEEKIVTPLFNERGEIVNFISTGRDITERKNTEQKLEAYRRLQEFQEKKQTRIRTLSLLQGQEEERKRIARELHDGLGQILSATKLHLGRISSDDKRPALEKNLNIVHQMVVDTISEVRRISNDLSPAGLHDFGLHSAIRNLVSKIGESLPLVRFAVNSNLNHLRFKSNVEINVFRIVQEAINNALKHSGASKIEINLLHTGTHLRVSVMDNGVGFTPGRRTLSASLPGIGNGLPNMRERAKIIGGKLVVLAEKDSGVLISFELKTLPIKK